jgi:class 3 adenylate cyclase
MGILPGRDDIVVKMPMHQGARARAWLARRLRRRPPFWLALVLLVGGFTALTGAAIGLLAWHENRETSRALLETAMARTARLAADQAEEFLASAESVARLGPELVRTGALDPTDDRDLERFVLGTLRANPGLSWVSYGSGSDRFVGAWRDASGAFFLNRSFPAAGGTITLEEDAVASDGRRAPVRRSDDHGYRPTQRPFFRLAAEARQLVWTGPYEFWDGKGLGVTCAVPLLDAAGTVQGVFTVDFSVQRLAALVERLEVSPRGHVFIADREGEPIIVPRAAGDASSLPRPRSSLMRRVIADAKTGEGRFVFDHRGVPYLGHVARLHVGDVGWLVEVIVPEGDYTSAVDASMRRALLFGVAALLLAIGGGVAMARWIARPLGVLAEAARRIRRGNLDLPPLPMTRDEIGVLGRAMADVARAIDDREFVRGVLGRFVNPEVAERVLRDRNALRLGGELRDVSVLFSDLRGFSELSEQLGAEAAIQLVNRYLAAMTPVILAHQGTIVDFIGDGIFVMFGAPFAREDAAAQALRCAWAMQEAMDELNIESGKLGVPEIAMGIAIHSGRAVVGNIGSDERVKYGPVGPPVNLAAHLQAHARAGEVIVTAPALARGGAIARVGDAREVELKGRTAPVLVYPLVDVAPA